MSVSKYHLAFTASSVFLVLNVFENLLHYNIGLHRQTFHLPDGRDALRIGAIMTLFAFLQGALTSWLQ
jgi:hypothetical protein